MMESLLVMIAERIAVGEPAGTDTNPLKSNHKDLRRNFNSITVRGEHNADSSHPQCDVGRPEVEGEPPPDVRPEEPGGGDVDEGGDDRSDDGDAGRGRPRRPFEPVPPGSDRRSGEGERTSEQEDQRLVVRSRIVWKTAEVAPADYEDLRRLVAEATSRTARTILLRRVEE